MIRNEMHMTLYTLYALARYVLSTVTLGLDKNKFSILRLNNKNIGLELALVRWEQVPRTASKMAAPFHVNEI